MEAMNLLQKLPRNNESKITEPLRTLRRLPTRIGKRNPFIPFLRLCLSIE